MTTNIKEQVHGWLDEQGIEHQRDVTITAGGQTARTSIGEFAAAAKRIADRFHPPEMESGFMDAPDIVEIAHRLIAEHKDELSHLTMLDLRFLWKAKGGKASGTPRMGKVQSASGLLAYYSEADFIVWLAADNLRELEPTRKQVEALAFHLLLQIGLDAEKGVPALRVPEIAAFEAELRAFGAWSPVLAIARQAFSQLDLFEAQAVPAT